MRQSVLITVLLHTNRLLRQYTSVPKRLPSRTEDGISLSLPLWLAASADPEALYCDNAVMFSTKDTSHSLAQDHNEVARPESQPADEAAKVDSLSDCETAGCPGHAALKARIIEALQGQGFDLESLGPNNKRHLTKPAVRLLHEQAVLTRRNKARRHLGKLEDELLGYIANGSEVEPTSISPQLVRVQPRSQEERLFRYARLHWSIPVSSGYGRRLRYLVMDGSNGKLIGLLGLGDPVFAIRPRDRYIGWTTQQRRLRLKHVMDAFVLGAVPPYNCLLCGKLIALIATSNEVRKDFRSRYAGTHGLISDNSFSGDLALITTTSALGRSSIYNRLTLDRSLAFVSVGVTAGSGDFHFSNDVYDAILAFARHHCRPSSKASAWGTGWRNRREVVRSVLAALGMSRELLFHGLERELFVAPLAENSLSFLRGDANELDYFDRPLNSIFDWFRDRWLLKRAARVDCYSDFNRETLRLWGTEL